MLIFLLIFFHFITTTKVLLTFGANWHNQTGTSNPNGTTSGLGSHLCGAPRYNYPYNPVTASYRDTINLVKVPYVYIKQYKNISYVTSYEQSNYWVVSGKELYAIGMIKNSFYGYASEMPMLYYYVMDGIFIESVECNQMCVMNSEGNNVYYWKRSNGYYVVREVYGEYGFVYSGKLGVYMVNGTKKLWRMYTDYYGLQIKKVNMTGFGDEDMNEIKDMFDDNYKTFVVFNNNNVYAWGADRIVDSNYVFINNHSHCFFTGKYEYNELPLHKMDIHSGSSTIPSENYDIIQISCTHISCFLLIEYEGKNDVYSWGYLTRTFIGRDPVNYEYPDKIDDSYFDVGDEVSYISVDRFYAYNRFSVMLLMKSGKLYAFGGDTWLFREYSNMYCGKLYDNDKSYYDTPRRIAIGFNVSFISKVYFHLSYMFLIDANICYDIYEGDDEVCSGGGDCIGDDVCECHENYYGHNCSVTRCGEYLSNNTLNVCNGRGRCYAYDQCECEKDDNGVYLAEGYLCSSPVCNYKLFNVSCNDGECVEINECDCSNSPNHYGYECEILIKNARFGNIQKDMIYITYKIDGSYISDVDLNLYNISCSDVIQNPDAIGEDLSCIFNFDSSNVSIRELIVTIGGKRKIKPGDKFYVIPITLPDVPEKYAKLKLKKYSKTFLSEYWIYFFVVIPIFLNVLLILCISILLIIKLYSQSRKLKKYRDIEDIDILLDEQNANQMKNINFSINKKMFVVNYEDIKLLKIISGSGSDGTTVYLAKWCSQFVVFKVFMIYDLMTTNSEYDEFEKELEITSSLSYPHIINFVGASLREPRLGILMEYCEIGSLEKYIHLCKEGSTRRISLEEKLRILLEVALALQYLHSKGILHRDIKGDNVFLTSSLSAKLGDFGFSKIMDNSRKGQYMTKHIGTSMYMSPEMTLGKNYNESTDIFSYGILLFVIFFENFSPYNNDFGVEIKVASNEQYRPNISEYENEIVYESYDWLFDLMKECWENDPEKRPRIDKIIATFHEHFEYSGKENADDNSILVQKRILFESEEILRDDALNRKEKVERISDILSKY